MKIYWKWKTCYKSGNEKGGIKPCNVSFNMADSLSNYGKNVDQLLLGYTSAKIEI